MGYNMVQSMNSLLMGIDLATRVSLNRQDVRATGLFLSAIRYKIVFQCTESISLSQVSEVFSQANNYAELIIGLIFFKLC